MYRASILLALLGVALICVPSIAGDYVLAPDDVVEMNVWREPDLSKKQFQISTEGNITVPYLNFVIHAAGMTPQELTQQISNEYKKAEILTDPKIEINLISKHRMVVWVLGQVQKPGVVQFKEGDTISSAVAEAGSYSPDARLDAATLTHKGSEKQEILDLRKMYQEGDMSQNYPLQEGDVIFVPEDTYNRFYVLGEVNRPGLYILKENTSVLSAVSQAGGQTERGAIKNTMLVRGDPNNPEKREIDLAKMVKGDQSQDVRLEPGDIVYVPETKKPDWSKISQFLNVITSVGYIRRYGLF